MKNTEYFEVLKKTVVSWSGKFYVKAEYEHFEALVDMLDSAIDMKQTELLHKAFSDAKEIMREKAEEFGPCPTLPEAEPVPSTSAEDFFKHLAETTKEMAESVGYTSEELSKMASKSALATEVKK